jgi:hypothetical protein
MAQAHRRRGVGVRSMDKALVSPGRPFLKSISNLRFEISN